MEEKAHHYNIEITWTGNRGTGTSRADQYERSHTLKSGDKTPLECSSDPAFRGDKMKYNPEDLFLYSLSSCHMLWYLHLCADAGIIVTDYVDRPKGTMIEFHEGGRFTEVTLLPEITITDKSRTSDAIALHKQAHAKCFIANSCNFPVKIEAKIL